MRAVEELRTLAYTDTDDCVLWPRALTSGYPRLSVNRKMVLGHSLVCTWTHGLRPSGMQAAHACGVQRCVNARHIRWRTARENIREKIEHGTMTRGVDHPRAALTEDDVRTIRRLAAEGEPKRAIARRYADRVTRGAVMQILRGNSWAWLDVAS